MGDTYTHGHHDSVLRSHRWRTAENSAAYLLPTLRPGQDVLDVGCGPGTITLDLAGHVAPGSVTGVDADAGVIAQATSAAGRSALSNVSFVTGDVYGLGFPDDNFDVVHAHQVLQHVTRPVEALNEMRRVLRPGGTLAVRDGDYGAFVWAPDEPLLERWLELYHQVTARNGAQANAGRYLAGWVDEAGFVDVRVSSSTWTFSEPADRAWWGGLWSDRCRFSGFAEQAVSYGLADAGELQAISEAWLRWATQRNACFIVVHAEVLARA
jgi:ubiquinone/menaquinone biosynthesis C-methylase UbiE